MGVSVQFVPCLMKTLTNKISMTSGARRHYGILPRGLHNTIYHRLWDATPIVRTFLKGRKL